MMNVIVIPVPHYGFDPTEAAVPWDYLDKQGVEIVFATPDGQMASADERLLTGRGFGPLKKFLMADSNALTDYRRMIASESFKRPLRYADIYPSDFEGLLLPGGHDKGMKTYLESQVLQEKVSEFFLTEKTVGAICHGTVLAARSINSKTNKSVLYDYGTTSLLKAQEMGAYYLTALWLKDYYRTYSITVEDEVKSVLKNVRQFQPGSLSMNRDSLENEGPAFVVEDRNYVSARWPGDAHTFAKKFYRRLKQNY